MALFSGRFEVAVGGNAAAILCSPRPLCFHPCAVASSSSSSSSGLNGGLVRGEQLCSSSPPLPPPPTHPPSDSAVFRTHLHPCASERRCLSACCLKCCWLCVRWWWGGGLMHMYLCMRASAHFRPEDDDVGVCVCVCVHCQEDAANPDRSPRQACM